MVKRIGCWALTESHPRTAPEGEASRGMLKMAISKAAADERTGGVAFLTRPSRAAKTARFPSGLR